MSEPQAVESDTETERDALKLTISLNVLHHLGRRLYSNVPAVLAELVANAWDADAEIVKVDIDRSADRITIWDDGHGMSRQEVNDYYLHVGYGRREDGRSKTRRKKRHVMGRKGIGKLSVFGIADLVHVYTASKLADGTTERTAFEMSVSEIDDAIEREREQHDEDHNLEVPREMENVVYRPVDLVAKHGPGIVDFDEGTKIVLQKLDKRLVRTDEHLRRRVARRFSIVGPKKNFEVFIDGERVTAADRDYYSRLEFIWTFGRNPEVVKKAGKSKTTTVLSDRVVVPDPVPTLLAGQSPGGDTPPVEDPVEYKVSGWIGSVSKPSDIPDVDTGVSVFAHGKLVSENILRDIKESRVFAQYLTGEIYADFLDVDGERDIVTSDRQSVLDDERYEALVGFVRRRVNEVGNQWTELRNKLGEERALSIGPIKDWFERLPEMQQPFAQSLFQNIEKLRVPDERTRVELYKSGLMAFERLALDDALERVDRLETEREFSLLGQLFESIDAFEAAQYYQITRGRLRVVEDLLSVESGVAKQRILAEHVYDHLWLLDPSWGEPVSTDLVDAVQVELDRLTNGSDVEGRVVGPRYRPTGGRHVIVDLRRYDSVVDLGDEYSPLSKLVSGLRSYLASETGDPGPPVELICIAGRTTSDEEDHRAALGKHNIRVVLYDRLIQRARSSFSTYLDRQKRVGEVTEVIHKLDRWAESFEPKISGDGASVLSKRKKLRGSVI